MTISSIATNNPGGGGLPRKRSWIQSLKKPVLTGAGIGLVGAMIFASVGTWGDYPERMLVKTEARILFSPDHVTEAKVLHGGPGIPLGFAGGRVIRFMRVGPSLRTRTCPRRASSRCRLFRLR